MSGTGDYGAGGLIGALAGRVRLVHLALSAATDGVLDAAGDKVTPAERWLSELDDPGTPAGADPHAIVVGAHVGAGVECLAVIAGQLVALARSRQSGPRLPERLRIPLRGMGDAALGMVAGAAGALESGDVAAVADLLAGPYEIAQRQRLLYRHLLYRSSPDTAAGDLAQAVLLSCCYERCADHAVSIARHATLFADSRPAEPGVD